MMNIKIIVGTAAGAALFFSTAVQATFIGLRVEQYVGDGWVEHGYQGLTTYRIYANFDSQDDVVHAVMGSPKGAMEIAVGILQRMSREKGNAPNMRIGAAFSDGETLYAIRYASDNRAPTVYHRWSESRQGRAVVSEPLFQDETGWEAVAPNSFCQFKGKDVHITPFEPLA